MVDYKGNMVRFYIELTLFTKNWNSIQKRLS